MAGGPANESQSRANAESLGVIQQRLSTLESQVSQVLRGFSDFQASVASKFDLWAQQSAERGKTNWIALGSLVMGAVAVTVTVITIIGSLAKAPIETELIRNGRDILELRANIVPRPENEREWNNIYRAIDKLVGAQDTLVTRREFETRGNATTQLREAQYHELADRLRRMEAELDERSKLIPTIVNKNDLDKAFASFSEIRTAERGVTLTRFADLQAKLDQMLPRTEHNEFRLTLNQIVADQQRQLDELRKFNSELVSAKDTIKHLEDRVWALDHIK